MYNEIYEKIKKYDTIVIVRHIGADPDALASQLALRDSIRLTFPNKKVLAWGNSSARFDYLPRLDKFEELSDILLIVTDTPDKKRIDFSWTTNIMDSIKIDHHPYIETFCELEYIDDTASSASELILELINNTPLLNSDEIAKTIFTGIASDTNRFMFNASSKVLRLVSNLFDEYNVDITQVYSNLYMRPLNEVRLQGYIAQNIVVSENGFGYVKISNDTLNKLSVDSGSAGNMVNNFNYIEGMYVWAVITEDIKNNLFKVNIRSRGPVINIVAEKYNGGGHKMASGARLSTMEEVDLLLKDLDASCKRYLEERVIDNED
ncbi:MAG: bifunctional oligoribonuclease/PAP phosphatase NrnA [Bacilli bacterium]